ncbi:MAG: hypothetical protein WCF23_02280, partial [Candidatus Nitrosopolaris sp.]
MYHINSGGWKTLFLLNFMFSVFVLIISHSFLYDLSIQQANAIKPITSPQSNTSSLGSCINYNPSTRTISVSCTSPARLTDIDNKLHDSSILAKQSLNGVWFLNANLIIAKGGTFHIDSTDTKWLKISSKVTRGAGVAKIAPA